MNILREVDNEFLFCLPAVIAPDRFQLVLFIGWSVLTRVSQLLSQVLEHSVHVAVVCFFQTLHLFLRKHKIAIEMVIEALMPLIVVLLFQRADMCNAHLSSQTFWVWLDHVLRGDAQWDGSRDLNGFETLHDLFQHTLGESGLEKNCNQTRV